MVTNAADTAYSFVKEQIVLGVYAGGEMISEGDVAAQLSISRTPVREAFLRLQAEGWMRLYPKRGALVVAVTPAALTRCITQYATPRERLAAIRLKPAATKIRRMIWVGVSALLTVRVRAAGACCWIEDRRIELSVDLRARARGLM